MDYFLEVFFDKCDERCIAEKMLVNATLAASCGTIRRKICYDDGFMQMVYQAQFYLIVSLPPIMLITKVIEMVKKRAVDDRVWAAFHQGRGRNAGEAVDPASSWCVAMRMRMWRVVLLAPWWRYIAGAFLALTQLST